MRHSHKKPTTAEQTAENDAMAWCPSCHAPNYCGHRPRLGSSSKSCTFAKWPGTTWYSIAIWPGSPHRDGPRELPFHWRRTSEKDRLPARGICGTARLHLLYIRTSCWTTPTRAQPGLADKRHISRVFFRRPVGILPGPVANPSPASAPPFSQVATQKG